MDCISPLKYFRDY